MKRFCFFTGMLIIGSTVFAQVGVSIDGHVATNFTGVTPTIGVEINLNRIDILVETTFWFYNSERTDTNYETYNSDCTQFEYCFEFFAGIAPKVVITEKWSLTIPLLVKRYFRTDTLKYENSRVYSTTSPKNVAYLGYGLDFGARTYYALNQKWDVYMGIMWELVSIQHIKYTYWETADTTYTREYDTTIWLDNGKFELGVRFKVK
jgi:hypothetical protein